MQRWLAGAVLSLSLCTGCQMGEPPLPPTAPMPEDLSTWSSPTLIQPALEEEAPLALPKVPAGPAEKVSDYRAGHLLEVPVAVGQPVAILLEPGEQVRQIVDGDRAPLSEGATRRWQVLEGAAGSGPTQRVHLFITASEAGLTNGLTVTTTKRTYLLVCKSVAKSPVRLVRWDYPGEPLQARSTTPAAPSPLPPPGQPRQYHVGYTITSTTHPLPTWTPRQVVDDGMKLYLLYPEVTLFETVPLVRLLGTTGPQLVTSRQFLNVTILDHLAPRIELRVGTGPTAEVVTIHRDQPLQTIQCPEAGDLCPQWPAAAGRRSTR